MRIPLIPRGLGVLKKSKEHFPIAPIISGFWSDLARTINGRIDFGSPQGQAVKQTGNIDGTWPGTFAAGYSIQTPGAANTEFTVTHNLGRIPAGYDVKSQDAAGIVYDSRKASWTATTMFLKCNVASMNIVLFVH